MMKIFDDAGRPLTMFVTSSAFRRAARRALLTEMTATSTRPPVSGRRAAEASTGRPSRDPALDDAE
jgi:hypothetical protein